jgi:apolipoprotein N-acyltransferase
MPNFTRHLVLFALLAGLASAGLLALAFPPVGVWPVAFLIPVPALLVAQRLAFASRRRRLAIASVFALAMLPFYAWQHAFMWNVSELAYVLHQFYMVFWAGLFVFITATVFRWSGHSRTARLALPALLATLWTGVEFVRGDVFLEGFPFFFAAHPTIDLWSSWGLGNPASVLGTYFVSFLVVLPACTLIAMHRVNPDSTRVLTTPSRVPPGSGAGRDASSASAPTDPAPTTPTDRRERLLTWSLSAFILIAGITLGSLENLANLPGMGSAEAPTLRVAALQTNITQDNKTSWPTHERLIAMRRWLDLSRAASRPAPLGSNANWKPHLIVWPETMFPGPSLNASARAAQDRAGLAFPLRQPVPELGVSGPILATVYADALLDAQKSINIPMLIGAIAEENLQFESLPEGRLKAKSDGIFNSMFLVRDGAVDPTRYDKIKLTPFGETLPFFSRFPALQQWVLDRLVLKGLTFELRAGTTPVIFSVPGAGRSDSDPARVNNIRIAAPICYETVWAWACRAMVHQNGSRAADIMINASNDGWYGPFSPGRPNFLLLCRWRCAELNTPMVHVANTGISAHIDAQGRIVRQGPDDTPAGESGAWREGVLRTTVTVPTSSSRSTTYARIGDVFGVFTGIIAAILGIVSLRRTKPI